jgi:hypothetical protein
MEPSSSGVGVIAVVVAVKSELSLYIQLKPISTAPSLIIEYYNRGQSGKATEPSECLDLIKFF